MEGTQHLQRNNRITVATIHTLKEISKDHTFHHASSAAQFLGTAAIDRRACVGSSHSPKPKPIQLRVVPQQYHIENTFLPNHSSTSHLPPLTSDPSHLSPLDPMPLHSHLSHLTLTSHPPHAPLSLSPPTLNISLTLSNLIELSLSLTLSSLDPPPAMTLNPHLSRLKRTSHLQRSPLTLTSKPHQHSDSVKPSRTHALTLTRTFTNPQTPTIPLTPILTLTITQTLIFSPATIIH